MAIYMELEGVNGNVTAAGYSGHIALKSARLSVQRNITMKPGGISNREATRPQVSYIFLTKEADSSVTALFRAAVAGSTGKKAVIKFVKTGADKVQQFMDYTLENCIIAGYSMRALSSKNLEEAITLSFSKVLVNYSDFDAANKSTSPQRVGYDLSAAKPL